MSCQLACLCDGPTDFIVPKQFLHILSTRETYSDVFVFGRELHKICALAVKVLNTIKFAILRKFSN